MFKNLFGGADSATPGLFYKPYQDPSANHIYNLLFCDNLALFNNDSDRNGSLSAVLSDATDRETLERIGYDPNAESRVRLLAFHRLRALKVAVPARQLLGTIIEAPQEDGLDVLAVFSDGRLRYINQNETFVIFETTPPALVEKAQEVLRASQAIVDRIGPSDQPRRPPPTPDVARMSFLVSDGLYFGEASFDQLFDDQFAAPVIGSASELLNLLVDVTLEQQHSRPSA